MMGALVENHLRKVRTCYGIANKTPKALMRGLILIYRESIQIYIKNTLRDTSDDV